MHLLTFDFFLFSIEDCCFDVKPQPYCNIPFLKSAFTDSNQTKVISTLATYLPLFYALESINMVHCASQLSSYLCLKNFMYCSVGSEFSSCPSDTMQPSRQDCLSFFNTSSPCSVNRMNNALKNAGYGISVPLTDINCSVPAGAMQFPFLLPELLGKCMVA